MHILHAFWGERMHLWVEAVQVEPSGTKLRRGRHPFALDGHALKECLEGLLATTLDDLAESTLRLPTAGGRPIASPDPVPAGATLATWTVPTIALAPAHAAVALADLPACPDAVVLAADARAWSAVGRFVLALVARERAVPSLSADGTTASWLAVLDDAGDQARLNALAAGLPPSGRAQSGDGVATARAAVIAFVQQAVDDYIGGVASERSSTQPPARWPEEVYAWARTLTRGETEVSSAPGRRTLERLGSEIARWTEPVRGHGGAPPPFRTCFRLEPPEKKSDWKLEILAQASDDPSQLQPARDAWKSDRAERLLADLGRAVRVFPTLGRALAESRPTALALKLDEAANFLRDTSFLLQDSGFGVLVPGDRLMRTDAFEVTLRVRPKQERKVGSGLLGLDQLVSYDWSLSLGDETISLAEFRKLAASKVALVQVRGQWVLLDAAQIEKTLKVISGGAAEMTLREAMQMTLRDDSAPLTLTLEGALAALNEPARMAELEVPTTLRGTLRPYQRRGFSWMSFLTERGMGSCLADDMGLGKTVQVLTLLLHRERRGAALLVCPTSLVGNWQRESAKFAPSLRVGVHHGHDRKKKSGFAKWAEGFDVVLTTYALAARDEAVLGTVEWDALVLDESQNIKNPEARQARAVKRLRAGCRIAMSGTPVENRLTDLWSLMDFLNPGLLGTREAFRRNFVVPVERWGDARRASQLRAAVGPFVLRRLKTDPTIISDLPEKQEMKVYCPLTREQATLYQATVSDMLARIERSEGIQRHGLVLSTMLRLKQICNHPALFLEDGSAFEARRSGKLQRLTSMLEEVIEAGDRALIFTQFSSFGEQLQRVLGEGLRVPILLLTGATPRKERDALVARFQTAEGPPIFVLSVKAGGVGLNLTQASHVFHYDRWWNPAVENQATDRAFRIGQRRNVQVHKFICQGTLEEAIDALIESKLKLADSVVGSGESWLAELDTRQLRRLFTLQAGAVEEDE